MVTQFTLCPTVPSPSFCDRLFGVPEGVEIELYRQAMLPCVGRVVADVVATDHWYLKGATTAETVRTACVGAGITDLTRTGKLLRVHMVADEAHTFVLGLRFGMTGRPVLDQIAAIDDLRYTSNDYRHEWVRFALRFTDGSQFEMIDPRRLGGVDLDPLERLGPDVSTVTTAQLTTALARSQGPLKAALLQQDRVAGIGNLLADEILWQCSIAPTRIANQVSSKEMKILAHTIRSTFKILLRRGGSHLGDLVEHRSRNGTCPRRACRRPVLNRATIGGRTTYWCPVHQQ